MGLVLPQLKGKLDGFAIRVPTINVSVVDLTFKPKRNTTVEEINSLVKAAANGPLKGVLAYTEAPLVSVDYNHDPASSTYDASLTKIIDGKPGEGVLLVRQRMGFLEPHARHGAGLEPGEVA